MCFWLSRPNASAMRRRTPSHFSQATSTSAASPEAPTSYSRSGPLQSAGPRWTNSSHGKSSRWPLLQATRKRAGTAVGGLPSLVQLRWT